ncbi:MAG TPA: 2,3-bisphosphoglycerate-independent phosphoglycerate mutase [Gammaproteobacteria bacterium]|jgi:2,3-bisphosphoglycerate-independent phosphoglycerate mutase
MSSTPKPVALIILDGWGYSESPDFNGIEAADKPFWDHMWATYPHSLVRTSGIDVGLPAGQMGNSEVGHVNLGAGRVVYQEATRIDRSIKTGSFFENATLTGPLDAAIEKGAAVHVFGLLSDGGVHSYDTHLHAMVKMAAQRGAKHIYLHAFTDGRDTPPQSALASVKRMQAVFDKLGVGRFASIIGRYYAMDRDKRWDRVKMAYDLIFHGKPQYQSADAISAINESYEREESDEFIHATSIGDPVKVNEGDALYFMNFRADRARQLARAIVDDEFDAFDRGERVSISGLVSLTEYDASLNIPTAFPPERLENVLGEYVANKGLRQLRLAETEKYAHVTFFFNGGVDKAFEGEDRILVPSPDVSTYDLHPEMSADKVTDHFVEAIESGKHDLIVCNFANTDMVGHTGNQDAVIITVETIDHCLKRVIEALVAAGGEALITADHGNAELLFDVQTGQRHTAHTTNPVPLIYVGRPAKLQENGVLSDLAPTLLAMMGLPQPEEMTGRPLLEFTQE